MILKKIKKQNRAFVILFAVTVAAILLSIALGVANISLKEIKFGTSVKDTNDAFFAADAGLECAMLYDKSQGGVFISPNTGFTITCNNISIAVIESSSLWTFTVPGLNNGGQGCAKVTVDKTDTQDPIIFTVTSKGYNNDDGGEVECTSGPNTVERQIELTY